MIVYTLEGIDYKLDINELREKYRRFCFMDDKEFMENIGKALHFSIYVVGLKSEVDAWRHCMDDGICHLLAHLNLGIETHLLPEIREKFREELKLIA